MKATLKILNTLIFISLFATPAGANENGVSREGNCKFEKSVKVSKGYTLELTNKFGSVSLINNKSDSIRVCATVTIVHESGEAMIQKSLPLITVSFEEEDRVLSVETLFDSKFFTRSFSSGRSHFSVDYIVELPEYINIDITNSYGNMFIPVISGRATLSVTNGNLEIQDLQRGNKKPYNSIDVIKSSLRINRINWGYISATYSEECFIGEANALVIKSVFSNLNILKVGSVVINSNIGVLSIDNVQKLSGELEFMKVNLGIVGEEADITSTMGQITLLGTGGRLKTIDITSDGTLINLGLAGAGPLNVDAVVTGGRIKMNSDTFPDLLLSHQNNKMTVMGQSILNDQAGKITIRSRGGSIAFY